MNGTKLSDDEIRNEMLADTVSDPPLPVQLELLRQQFQVWTNSYFASRANLRVAHEAGMQQLEQQYFDEAKRFRVGVQKIKAEIEWLEKHLWEEGHQAATPGNRRDPSQLTPIS